MTISVGRLSLDVDPQGVREDAGTLDLDLSFVPTGYGDPEADAVAQQLGGLTGNDDEAVVPLVWDDEPRYDGFYRPVSVSVNVRTSRVDAKVRLERLPGFANPVFEVTTQSVVRTNAHSIAAPSTILVAHPRVGNNYSADMRPALTGVAALARDSEDGELLVRRYIAPTSLTQFSFDCSPESFYAGGCRVEVLYGTGWWPVVGRNIPARSQWRISNGTVRLTAGTDIDEGMFGVWNNDVSLWNEVEVAHWTAAGPTSKIGSADLTDPPQVTILRNGPEAVSVRVSGASRDVVYTIQRGAHFVTCSWTRDSAVQLGAGFVTPTATTLIGTANAGIRATSADVQGNRVLFSMPAAFTPDNTNGGLYNTAAATSGQVMIGVELNGAAAVTHNAAAEIVNQFIGATAWTQRVVVR